MGKKRNLANENIGLLIDLIVLYEESDMRNNCPKPRTYEKWNCPRELDRKVSCEECKAMYLDKKREEMIKKYIVN